jgi:hypothetical protein
MPSVLFEPSVLEIDVSNYGCDMINVVAGYMGLCDVNYIKMILGIKTKERNKNLTISTGIELTQNIRIFRKKFDKRARSCQSSMFKAN